MDITLDDTDKLISLSLGAISLIGVVLRKWFIPKVKSLHRTFIYLFSIPERLKSIEKLACDKIISEIDKELPLLHSEIYILKYKCNFLLNNHQAPMYECDLFGDCIWSNKAIQKVFGLSAEDMLRSGWLRALHPEDIVPTSIKWKDCVQNWVPYKARYKVINQETQETYYCETSAMPICDEEGNKVSYIGRLKFLDKESYP